MPAGVLFIHNLRLVPLEQQTTRFPKALIQKAFTLDTVGNLSVNIEFLDFMPTLVRSFAVNFAILDLTSMPMHSFTVNIDILDFALSVSTKERCCIDPATI